MKKIAGLMFLLYLSCGVPAMVPPTKAETSIDTANACLAAISVCHSKSCLLECRQPLAIAQDDPDNLHVYVDGRLQEPRAYVLSDGQLTFVGSTCDHLVHGTVRSIDVVQGCSGVSPMPTLP
jgi:hypothetical protein